MSDKPIIDLFLPPDWTPRQRWGNTALQKHFHGLKRDFEAQNWRKDLESIDLLLDAGYKPKEVDPIIRHFNAGVDYLRDHDTTTKDIFSYVIETREIPSNPPKNIDTNPGKIRAEANWLPKFLR